MPGSRPRRGRDANTCLLQAALLCERGAEGGVSRPASDQAYRPPASRQGERPGRDLLLATQHTMHARRSVHDWITTTRSDSGGGEGASDDDETRDRYHGTHGRGTWVTHVYVEPNPGEIRTGWKPPQGCGNVTTSRRNVPGRAAGAILVHRAGK
jgi:hypothetical protein